MILGVMRMCNLKQEVIDGIELLEIVGKKVD